jgi:hypothetical protein
VIRHCHAQHGTNCWLYPPLVDALTTLYTKNQSATPIAAHVWDHKRQSRNACAVRLYSIEVWNDQTDELVAGELGYTVGSMYTSMTGFSAQDSAGSVQLVTLGQWLKMQGFTYWDLGMDMPYKRNLGSQLIPRREFLQMVHDVRHEMQHLTLPVSSSKINCRDVIDGTATWTKSEKSVHVTACKDVKKVDPLPGRKESKESV